MRLVEHYKYEVEQASGLSDIEITNLQSLFLHYYFPFIFLDFSKNFQIFLDFFVLKNTENTRVIRSDGDLIRSNDQTADDGVKSQQC